MLESRCNEKYLPGTPFPEKLKVIDNWLEVIKSCQYILISTPSIAFENTLESITPYIRQQKLISATKGFCHSSYKLLDQIACEYLPDTPYALITGPSFAKEVASNLPTAVVAASSDLNYAKEIQHLFNHRAFRCYSSDDITGAEVGGAVKNALAIACGISDGLGFGANARAGLITRGLKEMIRLGLSLGSKVETFSGLSGLGDLVLTCTDNQSRNRRFGLLVGQGKTQKEATDAVQQVVEGIATTKAVYYLAQKQHIDMPIVEVIYQVLHENYPAKKAVEKLLSRTLKSE